MNNFPWYTSDTQIGVKIGDNQLEIAASMIVFSYCSLRHMGHNFILSSDEGQYLKTDICTDVRYSVLPLHMFTFLKIMIELKKTVHIGKARS